MSEQTLFDNAPLVNSPGEERVLQLLRDGTFRVDEDGTIWRLSVIRKNEHSNRRVRIVPRRAEHKNYSGYSAIRFGGKRGPFFFAFSHRIIWILANGPIPTKMQINHKNGDRQDNRLANLEMVTSQQNVRHSYDVLHRKPSRGAIEKLTENDVRAIRALRGVIPNLAIARQFGINSTYVYSIFNRTRWKHVL